MARPAVEQTGRLDKRWIQIEERHDDDADDNAAADD